MNAAAFPKLSELGLKVTDLQAQLAQMFAAAPVLNCPEVLALSMGMLSDEGGAALLGNEHIRTLEKLDLSHHFFE